jgi:hypothetical protein
MFFIPLNQLLKKGIQTAKLPFQRSSCKKERNQADFFQLPGKLKRLNHVRLKDGFSSICKLHVQAVWRGFWKLRFRNLWIMNNKYGSKANHSLIQKVSRPGNCIFFPCQKLPLSLSFPLNAPHA